MKFGWKQIQDTDTDTDTRGAVSSESLDTVSKILPNPEGWFGLIYRNIFKLSPIEIYSTPNKQAITLIEDFSKDNREGDSDSS